MPRPKTHERYVERVAVLAEEGLRPAAILRRIEEEAKGKGHHDYPSERTVRRLYDEYRKLPEPARRENALFRWPGSMESGALPWECARAALDLLRYRDGQRLGRPTVRQAKWFWRLRTAAPSINLAEANDYAATLAAWESARLMGGTATLDVETIEWTLAYDPWRSPEDEGAYTAARHRKDDPIPSHLELVIGSPDAARALAEGIIGSEAADRFVDDNTGTLYVRKERDGRQEGE